MSRTTDNQNKQLQHGLGQQLLCSTRYCAGGDGIRCCNAVEATVKGVLMRLQHALHCLQLIAPEALVVLQVVLPLQPAAVGATTPRPLPAGCPYPAAPLLLPCTAVPHAQGSFLQLIPACCSLAIHGIPVGGQAPSRGARPVPLHSQGSTHVMQGQPCLPAASASHWSTAAGEARRLTAHTATL